MRIRPVALIVAALLAAGTAALLVGSSDPEAKPKPRAQVLVFSKTLGFRHDSSPAGIAAIRSLGRENGFSVTATEDSSAFTRKHLRRFDVVVFLNTTGDVLATRQQAAFKSFIGHGG